VQETEGRERWFGKKYKKYKRCEKHAEAIGQSL
jgi:hypothetical protein